MCGGGAAPRTAPRMPVDQYFSVEFWQSLLVAADGRRSYPTSTQRLNRRPGAPTPTPGGSCSTGPRPWSPRWWRAERIGQPLPDAHPLGERARERPPPASRRVGRPAPTRACGRAAHARVPPLSFHHKRRPTGTRARRLQDIESDMGYDTLRCSPDGAFARVSQTAVYDTCGSATPASQRRTAPSPGRTRRGVTSYLLGGPSNGRQIRRGWNGLNPRTRVVDPLAR